MLRITALNESEEEDLGDDVSLTKEAQEAIAESEYMRAMRLKCGGKVEHALLLLEDLLETKVLNEISTDKTNDKLRTIRYNCYKNIAFIFEEKKDFHKALQNYVLATQLDENDVYTMSRFGQLALKSQLLEMADYAFDNCLRRNHFHWPAADGMLRLHCQNYNIIGAYSWALKILLKDPNYTHALEVISEINNMFPDVLSFYNAICLTSKIKFGDRKKDAALLTAPDSRKETSVHHTFEPINLNTLQLKEINWLSIGEHIIRIYNKLKETNNDMMFVLDISCFQKTLDVSEQSLPYLEPYKTETLDKEQFQETILNISIESGIEKDEVVGLDTSEQAISTGNNLSFVVGSENNSQQILQSESANEDSDLNVKNENIDNFKPKSRRRCSDLHFLEQWGWHKNRRYSSRKKNQPERVEIDTSLKGYLERVFSKHIKSFEATWPFGGNLDRSKIDSNFKNSNDNNSIQKFQEETQIGFDNFFTELKKNHFDLLSLVYKWLQFLSEYWTVAFTEDLKTTYISVFKLYMDHFDFSSWNQFDRENMISSYRICLLFLELEYERVVHLESNISSYWKSLLSHLMYFSGYDYILLDKNYNINMIRLINMEYTSTKYENNLNKSVECLEHLECLVDLESDNFVLHLPNLKFSISKELVKHTRNDLLRKIKLNKVPRLFEEQKWSELADVIKDNLQHASNLNDCEYWIRDLKTQFEVLLQALWNMCDVENCLVWSEMCFDFVVGKYLSKTEDSLRQSCWAESINYVLTYLESSIIYEGYEILNCLGENVSRLIQNIIRVLSFHLDAPFEKNFCHDLDIKRPWVVLHQILLREESKNPVMIKSKHLEIDAEEIEDLIPQSFLILFTAHEFLGKRQLCTRDNGAFLLYILDVITPNLRAPLYDSFRDIVYEYLEQVTYCLYGFPPKKARSRHIEDHESMPIEITWSKGLQLFDLYRPECLPEFNSYKLESVSADMEQLLLKIVLLMSKQVEATPATTKILQFISGERDQLPDDSDCIKLPYKISSIYYLLADYYFKNRDFSKTLKYYTLDLACNPTRLDSWAGMSLSKASKIETKLNDFQPIDLPSFLTECEDTIRCFEQCIRLNQTQTLLWIEYGSFCYTIHSFCSRHLKQLSHKMSIEEFRCVEEKKENMLSKSYHCFSLAATLQNNSLENEVCDDESHEEKWLCQYMLGKITEKRKEKPRVYINYYLTAAHYLYESSATYPIKINHSNPTPLSVEALEVYYRTNSAIIKFLEHEKNIERETGVYFKKVLKSLSSSPFAFNKAKIDGNSLNVLKRKITTKPEDILLPKLPKLDSEQKSLAPIKSKDQMDCNLLKNVKNVSCMNKEDKIVSIDAEKPAGRLSIDSVLSRRSTPSRRNSNESSATAGSTTTDTASSSTSSSTNSSDASSTGSESDNDSDNIEKKAFYTEEELLFLYEATVKNLEECATRFPEHYKSIYRLVYHYMNAPEKIRNLNRCEQLLLGQYTTNLGNQINGIFFDRKSNNIFNGIWRLPSSEIDRPGSFSTHLVKCVAILIQMLMKRNNYKLLIDIGLQLYKTPDNDKRYIKDMERIELYQQSINFCIQIMKDIFKTNTSARKDSEILTLLIDIYKTHKKCIKHLNQKEPLFTQLLIDVYKFYIQDKIEKVPENLNFLDLAIKLCLQEISSRKNQEKMLSDVSNPTNLNDVILGINNSQQTFGISTSSSIHIPGLLLKAKNRTNPTKYNPNSTVISTEAPSLLLKKDTFKEHLDYTNSTALMNSFGLQSFRDSVGFQKLVAEYYKLFESGSAENIQMSLQQHFHSKIGNPQPAPLSLTSALPTETIMTPLSCNMKVENPSSDKTQSTCKNVASLTPKSTNYRGNDLVLTPGYSDLSDNIKNSLSLFIPPCTMSGTSDSKSFSTLYSSTKPREMLSPGIFYKSFADKSDTKPDATLLTKSDPSIQRQPIDQTNVFLKLAENLFNPGYTISDEKCQSKVTVSKTKKQKQLTPYSNQMVPSLSNKVPFDLLINTPGQTINAVDTKHTNQSTTFLSAYTDLFKNAQSMVNLTSVEQTQSKKTIMKRTPKSKVVFDTSDESQRKPQTIYPNKTQATTLNDGTSAINTSSFNVHSSNIASSFNTSLQQTTNPSSESSIDLHKSSPKTLQQKLAERQRASQQNDASETPTTNIASSIDVIILD